MRISGNHAGASRLMDTNGTGARSGCYEEAKAAPQGGALGWPVLALLLAAFAVAIVVVSRLPQTPARAQDAVGALSVTFVSIVLEALPFVALGSLIGGLIEVFVSRERVSALLPTNRTAAVFVAASLGLIFPVCECAIVPVTRRLVRKGVPFSVAVAYLLAGPIVNPLVAASTWVAYNGDWVMVVARLVCGMGVAVFVALIVDELFPGKKALLPGALEHSPGGLAASPSACGHDHSQDAHDHGPEASPATWKRVVHGLQHAADDFLYVGQFLVVGAFIAALSQTLVKREAFLALAETPSMGIGLMMGLAVILNLCSEADAFVAASFRGAIPDSAQLAFLVLGPMLDLKLIAMYLSFVRRNAVIIMAALMCALVFGLSMVLEFFGKVTVSP